MVEVWKDIEGFEGFYQVSNLGRVQSLDRMVKLGRYETAFRTIKSRVSSIRYYPNGYAYVKLHLPKQENPMLLHRLIAKAFIPNPDGKPCINHINGIKSDNRIENLEWVTLTENSQHALKTGLVKSGTDSHIYKLYQKNNYTTYSARKVKCTTLDIEFSNITLAAKVLGVNRIKIIDVCKGREPHTQGLSFRYI